LASLYLDHNMAHDVAVQLRQAGHDARTARQLRTGRVGDDEHLALAYQNGWIFVTHNIEDFELLYDAWGRWSRIWGVNVQHPGISILKPGPAPRDVATLVDQQFRSGTPIAGELHVWHPLRGWRQRR
jgi:hypothetical protein